MFNPRYTSFFILFYVVYSYYYSFKRLSALGSVVLITSVIHHNKLMNISYGDFEKIPLFVRKYLLDKWFEDNKKD